jgi:16S rRNA (guanine527-N7)-methyltransferase
VSFPTLERALDDAGLENLSPESIARLESYLALLMRWNSKFNLTAVREPDAIVRRHFVECIQCAQSLPAVPKGATLLDFGSGAGLPGIPIAICRPDIRVTLAESQRKKAAFLRESVRGLGLNAEVFDGRVEDLPSERNFSIVTLRAVDKMIEACRIALSHLALQGWMVIFATKKTGSDMRSALPGIRWLRHLPICGSDFGLILLGQKADSSGAEAK